MSAIHFNIPYTCQESADNVNKIIDNQILINENIYLLKCKEWFESNYPGYTAFMTTSCTRALELISLSLELSSDSEIILSPYTYVGVGNAFANYGAKLVFVDIDPQTMNINADLLEAAISEKTKAIVAMHYASIPCDMIKIRSICDKYNLVLIEDNAHGIQSSFLNQPLGSFGDFSCFSFDMQKNISCNEGGVLLCKKEWVDQVDVAYNNGTNKTSFSKGLVQKYEWIKRGSKFNMSEFTAAVLYPLLINSKKIITERKAVWDSLAGKIIANEMLREFMPRRMLIDNTHNGHILYLKFKDNKQRNSIMNYLNCHGVPCSFHYVPLDNSFEGKRNNTRNHTVCPISLKESNRLLRLPIHNYLKEEHQNEIVTTLVDSMFAIEM